MDINIRDLDENVVEAIDHAAATAGLSRNEYIKRYLSVHVADQLFDPMHFDAMVEAATRLRGKYIQLSRNAGDEDQAEKYRQREREIIREHHAVDSMSLSAIRAATMRFTEELKELQSV